MCAAAGGGDLGRAAEFAHHQDQRAVEQSTAFEIRDEGVEAAVHAGEQGLEALEEAAPDHVVAVNVEDAEAAADDDERDAGLDEAAGQQGLFAEAVAAVGVADAVGLAVDFDRFAGLAGEDHVEGLAIVLIEAGHRVAGVESRFASGRTGGGGGRDPGPARRSPPCGMLRRPMRSDSRIGS